MSRTSTKRTIFFVALAAGLLLVFGWWLRSGSAGYGADEPLPRLVDFNFHIRPILVQKCYLCHGPDPSSRKAGLRLDTFEGATALLEDSVRAIIPGDVGHSALVSRINNKDPEMVMPPPDSRQVLSQREIDLLTRWIEQGAEWKPHWSLIPPERVEPAAGDKHPVDAFVTEKLEERGLTASPPANKNSLIRRVAYVLTGLPPTPAEIDRFSKDNSPDAYERMVDSYLSSPAFGERWARHWMDIVRYAETKGHEFDYAIAGAWRYRDYLIRAFNDDLPYDQLVREHLAGDLLPLPRRNSETGASESRIATAFYTFTEGAHSPVDVRQDEADRIDNMIDVTTKTFQALTVSCARCHDHKFDPILTADYYKLFGVMESTRFSPVPANLPVDHEVTLAEAEKEKDAIRRMLAERWTAAARKPEKKNVFMLAGKRADATQQHTSGVKVIGDFRDSSLDGWRSDGPAFGKSTTLGNPVFSPDGKKVTGLSDGRASSRSVATGLPGALRSPDFTITTDFIGVRALGKKSSIRIVSDNFQLISYPIYGGMDQKVNTADWKNFRFDVRFWKGRKAYIEILPGIFHQHIYKQPPDAFIEVKYAIAFDDEWEEPPMPGEAGAGAAQETLSRWVEKRSTPDGIVQLNRMLKQGLLPGDVPGVSTDNVRGNHAFTSGDSTAFYNGVAEGFPVNSPVFIRGSYKDTSPEVVPRGFLSAIPVRDSVFSGVGSGRLDLASAILDERNPLTARVMVNRIWHHVFGRGIVETVDNFGLQGKLPTHPEMLDYLAIKFRDESWSIKKMIRFMMLSETFRRSSEGLKDAVAKDPENLLLSHYPLRRLEAEAIRDGMLAASGELNTKMYGPSVPAYVTDFMQGRGRPKKSGPLDGDGRRSIYLEVRRNFMQPMLMAFDLPIPFSTFGRRDVTNVPAQALIMMNDPFVHGQAERMAVRLTEVRDLSMEERIQWVYIRTFSRRATEDEVAKALVFVRHLAGLKGITEAETAGDTGIWKEYCHSVFNLKEFIYMI